MDHVLNWTGHSLSLKGPSVTTGNTTMLGHGGYFFLLLPFISLVLTASVRYFQSGKKKIVHHIRNSFFIYKRGLRQQLPSLRSVQTGSPSAPLGQRSPAMVLPPPHLLKMPQAHKPPPAPCLPPTTMQCLATLALTLLALEASLALAPALSLQVGPGGSS